jgi:hypothetical protein
MQVISIKISYNETFLKVQFIQVSLYYLRIKKVLNTF